MTRLIQPEEMNKRIHRRSKGPVQPSTTLSNKLSSRLCNTQIQLLKDAKERPRYSPGTSVSALLGFTYVKVHRSPAFATSSKQRIRSSAKNMFFVKMFIPWIPFFPRRSATVHLGHKHSVNNDRRTRTYASGHRESTAQAGGPG